MITFDKTRVEYGDNFITQKIDGFIIMYETPKKGTITSHLVCCTKEVTTTTDEEGNEITETRWPATSAVPAATKTFDDTFFEGNILATLHEIYTEELRIFNPEIKFTNTLL